MSKLQELIARLCQNGVPFIKLGNFIDIHTGEQFNKRDMNETGSYPVMNGGVTPSGFIEVSNEQANTITISQGGASAGFVAWQSTPFWCGAHCYVVRPITDQLVNRYLFFFLKNSEKTLQQMQHGAGIPALNRDKIKNLVIPVPPIEVQEEIVKILDRFAEYAAELQAELQARKEQYEYYRNLLLTFNPSAYGCGTDGEQKMNDVTIWGGYSYEISWKTMGEIMEISRGASPRPIQSFLTEDENGVPWIKIGDISPDSKYVTKTAQKITSEGASKSRYLKRGDFILSNSMSFGRPYILDLDGCIHDGWVSLRNFQESYIPDFLYHLLKSDSVQTFWAQNAGQGGAVSNLNADIIRKTPVPVPPIELQEKIVAILDRFETLVNDLASGLPAEIAAVKEQYEYYRDKLLTFKEKSA